MLDLSKIEPLSRAPYPYTELQEKCLRDLETTEEPQAHSYLMTKLGVAGEKFGYCCLGRFCIVSGIPKELNEDGLFYRFIVGDQSAAGSLPGSLRSKLKLRTGLGDFKRGRVYTNADGESYVIGSLTGMNDSGLYSFKDIAAYIRHDPWNVFSDPLPTETAQAETAEAAA